MVCFFQELRTYGPHINIQSWWKPHGKDTEFGMLQMSGLFHNGGIFLIWTEVLEKNRDPVACTMIKYYKYEESLKTMKLWANI